VPPELAVAGLLSAFRSAERFVFVLSPRAATQAVWLRVDAHH